MKRIYADIPKFKRVHHALVQTVKQNDLALKEIESSLAGPRSAKEQRQLEGLREELLTLKQLYIEAADSFVAGFKSSR